MSEDLSGNASESTGAETKPAKKRTRRTSTTPRAKRGSRSKSASAAPAEQQADLALEASPMESAPSAQTDPAAKALGAPEKTPAAAAEDRALSREREDVDERPAPQRVPEAMPESDQRATSREPATDERGGDERGGDGGNERGGESQPQRDGNRGGRENEGSQQQSRDDRRSQFGGPQHGGSREGGDQGNGFGFRKKFKKDKHRNKFFLQGGGGSGGGGGGGQRWRQPGPVSDVPAIGDLPAPSRFTSIEELGAKAGEIAGEGEPLFLDQIAKATHAELLAANRMREIAIVDNPGRMQLIENLLKWAEENRRQIIDRGHLDLAEQGHGFVVHSAANYRLLPESTYVPELFVRKFGLKRGVEIEVQVQRAAQGERCPAALVARSVMGGNPNDSAKVVPFEELVPYYPTKRILLEVPSTEAPSKVDVSMRCIDILTPVGFGQRGLIVAPSRTGKTIVLQGLANSVATNFPEARLIVLLVDERPEEVTDFRRRVKGEVVSSTFDESPESHVHAAEMVGEKARRLVECGEHVVILLDSITRLARAYNALASNSGKIMSGGVEATALQKPKRFFGAARNIEGAGSLTIMGTALVDTNSRMDEVIFEEFKGTGNMELHLDRDLVNKRIFPAINFEKSGTRKEELLYHPDELLKIFGLRRIMLGVPAHEAMEMLIQRLRKTRSNPEFLLSLSR